MALNEYYSISEAEFDAIMEEYRLTPVTIRGTREKVYDRSFGGLILRVHSSIERGTARDVGKDAIRVSVIDRRTEKGVMKNKRVHRIVNWEKNLRNRLDNTIGAIKLGQITIAPDCPKCGAPMVLRKAKKGANKGNYFWGCSEFSAYPRCYGSRNY